MQSIYKNGILCYYVLPWVGISRVGCVEPYRMAVVRYHSTHPTRYIPHLITYRTYTCLNYNILFRSYLCQQYSPINTLTKYMYEYYAISMAHEYIYVILYLDNRN